MKLSSIFTAALALTCMFSFSSKAFAAPQNELNFGIISTESSQNLKAQWEPFLKRMEEETGLKIKAFFAPDYAGIITGMQYNKVQIAWYGNKSAIEAVDRAQGEIFAQTMDVAGVGGYYSHIIVHKSSPINSIEDMFKKSKELSFSNGDPNSTSGFLVPGYYVFAKNNVDPKTAFKRTLSANHEGNALAVINKQVDVATNNSEVLSSIATRSPEKAKDLKVIWTSPLIPGDPLVWRADLAQDTKNKISKFLFSFGVSGSKLAADKEILKVLGWAPFKAATNDHSIPIRQLELFKNRIKVDGDANLSAQDKSAKLAEIDAALAKLNARAAQLKTN